MGNKREKNKKWKSIDVCVGVGENVAEQGTKTLNILCVLLLYKHINLPSFFCFLSVFHLRKPSH